MSVTSYRTVARDGSAEIVVSRSRFRCTVARASDEVGARTFVEAIRREHWDARHHCVAYVLGPDRRLEQSSDDGGPPGTGGPPILDVIRGRELSDVVAVVSRWFGGTLLGTGRLALFDEWIAAGVEHRIYNAGWRGIFGRFGLSRTHRKLALVDERVAFCGGINVVDDFAATGGRLAHPRWDFAVELAGPIVAHVSAALDAQWRRLTLGHRPYRESMSRALVPFARAVSTAAGGRLRARTRGTERALKGPSVAFVARDNFVNRRAIEKAYLVAIGRARCEILLANPYFMPGRKLRRALLRAARRGVDVRVLIGRNEFAALDVAVPYLYRTFLKAGVHIAEYEKTMLHGKVAVVDSNWATVGSSNLDALSLVLNNEANVVLIEHPEIAELREAMLTAFDEARPIDATCYAARTWPERLANWLAYATYRAVMKLLTVGGYD